MLWYKMKSSVADPPTLGLFILFATYGGLLQTVLTAMFWFWSGMASLGFAYLIFVAPILMGIIAYRNYQRRESSVYHKAMFLAAALYFVIAPLLLGIGIWQSKR
jgi:hypothetical protein